MCMVLFFLFVNLRSQIGKLRKKWIKATVSPVGVKASRNCLSPILIAVRFDR